MPLIRIVFWSFLRSNSKEGQRINRLKIHYHEAASHIQTTKCLKMKRLLSGINCWKISSGMRITKRTRRQLKLLTCSTTTWKRRTMSQISRKCLIITSLLLLRFLWALPISSRKAPSQHSNLKQFNSRVEGADLLTDQTWILLRIPQAREIGPTRVALGTFNNSWACSTTRPIALRSRIREPTTQPGKRRA